MYEIMCFDKCGNSIDEFAQWDTNNVMYIDWEYSCTPIFQFGNTKSDRLLVVRGRIIEGQAKSIAEVNIPNILLQQAYPIIGFVYLESEVNGNDHYYIGKTVYNFNIPVRAKIKPQDYKYTENTEYISWINLEAEAKEYIAELESETNRFKAEYKEETDRFKAELESETNRFKDEYENILGDAESNANRAEGFANSARDSANESKSFSNIAKISSDNAEEFANEARMLSENTVKLTQQAIQQAKESGDFDGIGISNIKTTISDEDYGYNIISITLTDNTSYSFSVKNGKTGEQGLQGKRGNTFFYYNGDSDGNDLISVEEINTYGYMLDVGDLIIFPNGNLYSVIELINGEDVTGDKDKDKYYVELRNTGMCIFGKDGRGINYIEVCDDNTFDIFYTDGTSDVFTLPEGKDGRGIVSINAINDGKTLEIIYTDDTMDFLDLPNGEKCDGTHINVYYDEDENVVIEYESDGNINKITIPKVNVPVKGIDYWTDNDKADIVNEVIALVDNNNKYILPPTYMSEDSGFGYWDGMECLYGFNIQNPIVEGKTYIVTIDDISYTTVAEKIQVENDSENDSLVILTTEKGHIEYSENKHYIMYDCNTVYSPNEYGDSNIYGGFSMIPVTLSICLDEETNGDMPVKGVDYWTDEDKNEIINEVIDAVGNYEVILPITYFSEESDLGYWDNMELTYLFNIQKPIIDGKTYIVIIDGISYTVIAKMRVNTDYNTEIIELDTEYGIFSYAQTGIPWLSDDYNILYYQLNYGEPVGEGYHMTPCTISIYEKNNELIETVEKTVEDIVVEEQTVTTIEHEIVAYINSLYPFEVGKMYNIKLDGVVYSCVAKESIGYIYLGNPHVNPDSSMTFHEENIEDTGDVFCIIMNKYYNDCYFYPVNEGSYTISVTTPVTTKTTKASEELMEAIKAELPTVEMVATLNDGTTKTFKLYGEVVLG